MKATTEAQQWLLDLQEVDTTIDQLRHKRDGLPQHAQIGKIQAFRRQVRERIVASATIVSDLETEVGKSEADLLPVKERLERNQKRIDTGAVPDAKVLTSLIDEVAHLKRRIGELEDEQLDAMERLEAATERHASFVAKDDEATVKLGEVSAERDKLVGEIEQDIAARQRQRDEIAERLPADLAAVYERGRHKFGGVGAARLMGNRCGGCQLEATATDLDRYRTMPVEQILHCEECDRILIRN